jgi:nitrite reductase/ring-hydroxylating ferredoxin subunit
LIDTRDPAPADAPEHLCASSDLAERGRAFVWDVLQWGQPARAFALRFDGRVVAYLNRCAHVPTEMDWTPGEFLDIERRWILCSIHGAAYEPADGRCVGGPCGRARLNAIRVEERDGAVYWYPSRDTRPLAFDEPAAPAAPAGGSAPASDSP